MPADPAADPTPSLPPAREVVPALTAALLLAPILVPCMVRQFPVAYFDTDPRAGGLTGLLGLTPAAMAALHAMSAVLAAGVMAVHVWLGGRVRWGWLALFAVGAALAIYHLQPNLKDLIFTGSWLAAACVALAGAHLAQHDAARRVLLAGVIAAGVPMFVDGAWEVWVDHPQTIEDYERREDEILRMRGIERGSPQHELYRRRLTDPSATGATGLSNVFASFLGAGAVAALGLAVALPKRPAWPIAMLLTIAAACALMLLFTQSKGGLASLMATLGLLIAWALARRWKDARWVRLGLPALAVALVFAAAAAVLVRGWMGPPQSMEGERSILFRYHYWQATAAALIDAPMRAVVGVGAADFKPTYAQYKNPLNPEEVDSTHNAFIDLVAMLGVGGAAWSALLVGMLWAAGRPRDDGPDPAETNQPFRVTRWDVVLGAAAAVVPFGVQYATKLEALLLESALLWIASLVGFVAMAAVVLAATRGRRPTLNPLWLAAALLLAHGMIEMTYYQAPSAAFAWGVVGIAAGAAGRVANGAGLKPVGFAAAGVLLVVAILLVARGTAPTLRHQAVMKRAAVALSMDQPAAAMRGLDEAAQVLPADRETTRWRVGLRIDAAMMLSRMPGREPVAEQAIDEALAIVAAAEDAGLHPGPAAHMRSSVFERAAQALRRPDLLTRAAEAAQRTADLEPTSISSHVRLGDLLWETGQRTQAAQAYREALELSDLSYLDEAKQLKEEERQRLRERIEAASGGKPPTHPPSQTDVQG